MSTYWATNWPVWLSAFCVIAVYTYLFRDNALYRIMMQIFIGINLGYQAIIQWQDVLYPQWWLPMVDGFKALFGGHGSPWGALWVLVGAIGVLFYLQLSRKYASLSKIAIGITIGIGAGVTFKSQFGQNIPQLVDAFKPLAPPVVRPEPRVLVRLPGSDYPPAIDGSLGFFASGRTVVAAELLGGVQVWRTALPTEVSGLSTVERDIVKVPCRGITVDLDRGTGRILAQTPGAAVAPVVPPLVPAVYRQPTYAHSVEMSFDANHVVARLIKSGVAEGVKVGDVIWKATYPEAIRGLESFEGVTLVSGHSQSQVWEIPPPQDKLAVGDYFDNWVSVVTVLCVMSYFFFSFRRQGRVMEGAASVGRWLLMIGFGAFFGNTVMTRMSFLLDRLMFLIDDWLRPFYHHLFH